MPPTRLAMMLELMGTEVRRLYDPHAVGGRVDGVRARTSCSSTSACPAAAATTSRSALRAMPAGSDVLLVAVTGWGQPEDRRRTQAAGFDQHLVKPPELHAIRDICAGLGQRTPA